MVAPMTDTVRIANCSGFYGDRLSAAREMVEGGPIDVLTADYLAELTLMILLKDRLRIPSWVTRAPSCASSRRWLRRASSVGSGSWSTRVVSIPPDWRARRGRST